MRGAVGIWVLTLNVKKFQGNARGHFYYYCYLVGPKSPGKHICKILKAMLEGLDFILYRERN